MGNGVTIIPSVGSKSVTALADAAATLTAAQLLGGIFTITPTVARTLTTDTAANIIGALTGSAFGQYFEFTIVNQAAYTVTLAAGANVTIVGSAVLSDITGGCSGKFLAVVASSTTMNIYRITEDIPDRGIATGKIAKAAVTQAEQKIKAEVALADAAATLTATQLIDSGIFTITPTAGRALTTDTAANIVAGLSGAQVGTWFDIIIVCLAAFAATLTAGGGITITGTAAVNNQAATFRALITNIGGGTEAVTFYRATD